MSLPRHLPHTPFSSFASTSALLRSTTTIRQQCRSLSHSSPAQLPLTVNANSVDLSSVSTTPDLTQGHDAGAAPSRFDSRSARTKDDSNKTFRDWSMNAGLQYKWPTPGQTNWLGGHIPYPSNPYFKPEPPLSCDFQAEVYEVYTRFRPELGQAARIQLLADKYRISKDRIKGIIKTGQVGETWKKLNKPIQAPFARGMEAFLCVAPHDRNRPYNTRTPAMDQFPSQLSSRIDLDRDIESDRVDRGEITRFNEHLEGFRVDGRIGAMSWEFAEEGRTPMTLKMDLDRPLKPIPKLPLFESKLVSSGREAVWNFVDVKNKFVGQAWDGYVNLRGSPRPSPKGFIHKFMPLISKGEGRLMPKAVLPNGQARSRLSGAPRTARQKIRAAYAHKVHLSAQGIRTPTQQIIDRMTKPGTTPKFLVHQAIQQKKQQFRVQSSKDRKAKYLTNKKIRLNEFKRQVRKRSSILQD